MARSKETAPEAPAPVRVKVPTGTAVTITEPSVRVTEYVEADGYVVVDCYLQDAETIAALVATTDVGTSNGKDK